MLLYYFKDGEIWCTDVGSTTGVSSATTVPPIHSPAQYTTPQEEVHIPMETLSEVDGGTYGTVVHICLTFNLYAAQS